MPTANIQVPDVYESIIRRVAIDSVTQLANTMRLPPDTKILLPGNADSVPMNGGTFGKINSTGIDYPTTGRLLVTVNEESNDENVLSQHVGPNEQLPIFEDYERCISIYPIYRNVQNVMTLEYTAPNINIAQRWLDEMRTRVSQLRAELYQTLEYHYAIPNTILLLLHEVWSKIETSTTPENVSFKEYLDVHLCRPTTTIDTLTDTYPERVIKERQLEVLGWFDFTASPPKPEKDGNTGAYVCSVSYSFYYDRPHGFFTRWPLIVHNQAIDSAFHPKEAYSTFRQEDRRVSFLKGNLESFLRGINEGIPFIVHPDIDDFVPMEHVIDSKVFFSGLLVINPDDPTRLVDLSKLGSHTFTPYFLEYFYQQRHTLFNSRTSPFTFRLFENQKEVIDSELRLRDGSLVIETNKPLNLKRMYHIQIGIRKNWRGLTDTTRQCLRRYPVVTYTLLKALGIVLGNPCYRDVRLLGLGSERIPSPQCPGQGRLLAAPDKGGIWPWPWLSDEWRDRPWPGYVDKFDGSTWPGGSTAPRGDCDPPNWPGSGFEDEDNDDPTSPPTTPDIPGEHGDGSGTLPGKDLDDAIEETDLNQGNETNRTSTNANLVMYSQIIALNGAR